jgi:RNA polymerase sigma-70 factor, ECF subfamily
MNGALDRIFRENRQQLFTCALAVTRCDHRAEDAVQEAFFRLFRIEAQPENLRAYVFRAVRNAALDQLRKNPMPCETISESIFDSRPGPEQKAIEAEFKQKVMAVMAELSADESETIVQHLYGDLTFREIAEIREIPLGTVTSWYQRGLQKMRIAMEEKPWMTLKQN